MRLALAAAGHRIVYMSYVDSVGRCRVRRIYAALVHFFVVGLMRDDRFFLTLLCFPVLRTYIRFGRGFVPWVLRFFGVLDQIVV